ncbi:MAG: hypothetical protein J0L60_07400 [Ignavibacteria bacterium]|nr:hypothetical protein [Ignavibacteria bacterium]
MDSRTLFSLRNEAKNLSGDAKLNKLTEALNNANNLTASEKNDEWTLKAIAYIFIDLCKYFLSIDDHQQAEIYYQKLCSINFQTEDNIIEGQKEYLHSKLDINNSEVQKADKLSKNGNHTSALRIITNLISNKKLTELHHESYGWIIYRYLKAEEKNLSSITVRTFLKDYLNLRNERPSLLHSMILNFALNYSKAHTDFKFYIFFKMWNPKNLRYEDLHDGTKDENIIPSLISRIIKEFVRTETPVNIEEDILQPSGLDMKYVIDLFREPYFWNLINVKKEDKYSDLWHLFENYNTLYSHYGPSKWHSEILNLAERFMSEKDEWRFLSFLRNWNLNNFRYEDWKEVVDGEKTFKPLAIKSLKKAFEILKNHDTKQDLSWLIQAYEKAINEYPGDEWLLREKALLDLRSNKIESAIQIYKQLSLDLPDKFYIWKEFAACLNGEDQIKIGMLSKALILEKNEDFLGDCHLELAKILIENDLHENARFELEVYKKHRELKGWRLTEVYEELHSKVSAIKLTLKDNMDLYHKYIPFAENYVYSDFDWTELVLSDKWNDEKGKERLVFTDGRKIELSVAQNRFEALKQSDLGQIFRFKLYKQKVTNETMNNFHGVNKQRDVGYKYRPLIVEKMNRENWSILDETIAVVHYINEQKNVVHVITVDNTEAFFPQILNKLQVGDFIKAKYFCKRISDENRIELRNIEIIQREEALNKFQNQIAIVDGVNEIKQLFHYVINYRVHGIIKYSETNLRPKVGNFIKLWYVTKTDKEKNLRVNILKIEQTEEINPNLRKDVSGLVRVKFKTDEGYGFYMDSIDYDELTVGHGLKPDFAFLEDCYVPKYLLEKHNIVEDCNIKATAISVGGKWKVIDIEKVN